MTGGEWFHSCRVFFTSRRKESLFREICLISVGGKEKKKLDRFFADFWIKLNIDVGNSICVYAELYWRIGFGMLSLRDNWGRLDLCKMIRGRSDI